MRRKERAIISPLPAALFGEGRHILWLAKDAKAEKAFLKALQSQDSAVPLFLDRAAPGVGTLDLFMKNKLRKQHLVGGIQFRVLPDKIVVSHMIVEAKHRRRGLNSFMVEEIASEFPDRRILYYAPTKQGAAFMRARGGAESKTNPPRGDDVIRQLERQIAAVEHPARELPEVWEAYRRALLRVGRVPPGQALYSTLLRRAASDLRIAGKLLATEVAQSARQEQFTKAVRSAANRLLLDAKDVPVGSAWDSQTYYGADSIDGDTHWSLGRETKALSMAAARVASATSILRAVASAAERTDGEAGLATKAWAAVWYLTDLNEAISFLRDRWAGHSDREWQKRVERKSLKIPSLTRPYGA